MEFEEFLVKIKEIENMGYIKSHRLGDTGIGKTLEDVLGLVENNIAGPDFSVYELKSGRKDSSSMLTLFTKAPMPSGANKELLRVFGYQQRKRVRSHHNLYFIVILTLRRESSLKLILERKNCM